MQVPLLDLKAQYAEIREEVRAAVDRVLDSQRFILGSEVARLEQEVAEICGVPSAIAVASGTDALLISLKAVGVGPGDAVVTVPFTFFATAGAIVNLGARPSSEVYYPLPLHEQECFSGLGHMRGDFPQARDAARQVLALPEFPELEPAQLQFVADCIAAFYRQTG